MHFVMNEEMLIKKMIKDGQLNGTLYKYRSLSKDSNDYRYTMDIFANAQLWFSAPKDFNDPFDCKLAPQVSVAKSFAHVMTQKQTAFNFNNIVQVEKAITQIPNLQDYVKKATFNVMNRCGILSLTKTNDDILMWSHYADNHKGICLEFDVTQDYDFFTYPICIDYQTTYPIVDLATNDMKVYVEKLLKTKFIEWSYEKEVRIYKSSKGLHSFNPKALRNVYLGCKIDDVTKEEVYNVIRSKQEFSHVGFYVAKENETAYKLDFEQIDTV